MKRITITCDDETATTLTSLLMDQAFAFSVEPVQPNGAAGPPVPAVKKKTGDSFNESKSNKGLMAILIAGIGLPEGAVFSTEDVAARNKDIGLAASSASAALSHAKAAGYVASTGPKRFILTEKGRKAADRLVDSTASTPSPA